MRSTDVITQDKFDILSTSPSTSVGNKQGQQMRIQILISGFKGLIGI